MTEKQNRDIEDRIVNKMNEVKKEMTEAISSVGQRQDLVEKEQQNLKEQFENMKEQISDIKKIVDTSHKPTYSEALQGSRIAEARSKGTETQTMYPEGDNKKAEKDKIKEIIDNSRRTISLHPFTQKDVDLELKRGAENEDEAKLWAVQTFLRYEMNIKSNIQETFRILNIFPPAGANWDKIFVTFSNITTVNSIFSYTRNMRKEAKIDLYVPPECKERFKAVQAIA